MARCRLDISNPRFRASIDLDASLESGLNELRDKLAKDHTLSGWVAQPMPGFKDYQNKIWKWDFSPEGATSSTRKNWRLFAWVADPNAAEPVHAIPFLIYPRSENPAGNPAKNLARVLKKFLTENVEIGPTEERFRQQTMMDGTVRSMCLSCYETVVVSGDPTDIDLAESTHQCSVPEDIAAQGDSN